MTYGYGTVFQRSRDGRWCAVVETGSGRGADRRRKTFTGATREAVEARLAEYRATRPAPPVIGKSRAQLVAEAEGHHTDREWYALVRAVERRCTYCGVETWVYQGKRRPDTLTKDHRIPLTRGGSDDIGNIAVSCHNCNQSKGTMTDVEFIAWRGK